MKILVSGDTTGWITPCGCAANQSGGLLRRGSYVAAARAKGETLYLDCGGAPAGVSPYDLVKFRAILRGERLMGLAAHNLGTSEADMGPAVIRELMASERIPFISANLSDSEGEPVAPPMVVLNTSAGKLAVVGVISKQYNHTQWRVSDPREAALKVLHETRGQYTSAIVLAYAEEEELLDLARHLPEVDVILGGPTGQNIMPRRVGSVLVGSTTNKGKFLLELAAEVGRQNRWTWSGSLVELNNRIGDDPEQQRNLSAYLHELGKQEIPPEATAFSSPAAAHWPRDYRFAEPASCVQCHAPDEQKLKMAKHTYAYNELESRKMNVDPYCLRCHTTGYGLPGGFSTASRTPAMKSVTCQACHGPSQQHVLDPKVKTPYLAKDQCRSCHDLENSPHFAYDRYWMDIKHGEMKAIMPATAPARTREARQ